MIKFPKNLATAEDVRNCLEMVRAGIFKKKDLLKAIIKLENQNYSTCPILEKTEEDVTLVYCAEMDNYERVLVGESELSIAGVEHIVDEETQQRVRTIVTFNEEVPADATTVRLEVSPTIYQRIGMSKAEMDEIKEEMSNE
jgi:hypothetical protein